MFSATHTPGRVLKHTVENGDRVALRIDTEAVLAKDTKFVDGSRYEGEVYGFEPSMALACKG